MAHIVIDARSIFTTTGRYTRKLLEHLAPLPDDNTYTVVLPHDHAGRWMPPASRFGVATTRTPFFSLAEQFRFAAELRSLKPDLVHFTMQQQPLWLGAPRVTTFHDLTLLKMRNRKKSWIMSGIKRAIGALVFFAAARRGRLNIVPSVYSGDDLKRFARLSDDKIVLTYEAADPILEDPEPLKLPFNRFVLFVGNQVPNKNLDRLMDAMKRVRKTDPSLGLIVAGRIDGDGELILRSRHDISDYCHFTGYVSDGQLRWLYENARVYAFPSLFEGFGLPGLEAMRHDCPLISSSATCLPEVYGDAAYYFDPRSVDMIEQAILRVVNDEGYRANLIERGRRRVEEYSWTRMAEQTLAAYNLALDGAAKKN